MINNEKIRRVLVWPGYLRLAHGALAMSVLGLMSTGLLVQHAPSVATTASNIHDFFSAILVAGLVLRIWLLFSDKTTASWRALVPGSTQIKAMTEMLKFYLSFGKYKLPAWHAHNPIWMPLYIGVFILLLMMVITGFVMESRPVLFSTFYLPNLHQAGASLIIVFTVVHIFASIFHDVKGSGSDISAILNGYRIFILKDDVGAEAQSKPQPVKFYSPPPSNKTSNKTSNKD